MKTFLLRTIYKYITSVAKRFILNLITSHLAKLFTFLVNKYPFLYKFIHYIFTNLAVFKVYLYTIVFKLITKYKDRFPIIYSFIVYIYSEYLGIVKGDLSKNIGIIISLHVLFNSSNNNISLFTLLLLNTWCKQLLIENK